jgi:hypothetical protein
MSNLRNKFASANGLLPYYDPATTSLNGSTCQFGKFMDHTRAGARTGEVVSIYLETGYEPYVQKFFSALHSGSYHVDPRGRESLSFVLSGGIGFSWDEVDEKPLYVEDAVRVVCFRDDAKVHHYLIASSGITPCFCDDCGRFIA